MDAPGIEASDTLTDDLPPVLRAVDVSKVHGKGSAAVEALRRCSIELRPGTITVVLGPSGSGKSTLLHVLSGLDTPTTGRVWLAGVPLSQLGEADRARWRAHHIGFVLQRDNLIPSLTVEENVAAPLVLSGMTRAEAIRRARDTLDLVGLGHRTQAWPATISGGEAQRTAVARACAGTPRLIFSDEPTGALDSASSNNVLELFFELSRHTEAASLLVTHDETAAQMADNVVRIDDGWLRVVD